MPYKQKIVIVLVTIFVISGLTLVPPLIMRTLIDTAIPDEEPPARDVAWAWGWLPCR